MKCSKVVLVYLKLNKSEHTFSWDTKPWKTAVSLISLYTQLFQSFEKTQDKRIQNTVFLWKKQQVIQHQPTWKGNFPSLIIGIHLITHTQAWLLDSDEVGIQTEIKASSTRERPFCLSLFRSPLTTGLRREIWRIQGRYTREKANITYTTQNLGQNDKCVETERLYTNISMGTTNWLDEKFFEYSVLFRSLSVEPLGILTSLSHLLTAEKLPAARAPVWALDSAEMKETVELTNTCNNHVKIKPDGFQYISLYLFLFVYVSL